MLDLPVITPPIFPRSLWIQEITYSHIPIATLITAFMVLAPIYEYYGWIKNDPRYERLSKSLIWFALILFSPGAALGTGIPMWIIGTYPEFWSRLSNLFFWPLILQMFLFLAEVSFLFFGYYLAWDYLEKRKPLHLFFGVMAALSGLAVQIVWDSLASYMMTPGGISLPGLSPPVTWSAAAFFNPSFFPLFLHRFFGNISYSMLLVAGVFALKFMSLDDKEEKAYFGYMTNVTLIVGLASFFVMPFIGWWYSKVIEANAPLAFKSIMGGHTSPHMTFKMGLILLFILIATTYLFRRYRQATLNWGLTIGLASMYLIFYWHPPLRAMGDPAVWRIVYTTGFLGLLVFLWGIRGRGKTDSRGWQWALFIMGMAAFLTFCFGGFIRSRSRQPYTVYGELKKPEASVYENNRLTFYNECLNCHHLSEVSLQESLSRESWRNRWQNEHIRSGHIQLTASAAAAIDAYIEEHYP